MSPEPIITLQRRLTIVGAIRAGGEKPERGVGRKLGAWRLTSPREQLVRQAAELYGGPVSKWQSPVGTEWQVYTEAAELPVLVMPGYSLRQTYELWEGATKRTRLCDGLEEELTAGPCLCNQSGEDVCDLYTRLTVALPELDTVLGWRLITRGANAAHELPTMLALIDSRAGGATFVPARLRIDERRGVKDGQVVRFVVPSLDLGVGYLGLINGAPDGTRQLPAGAGFTPAEGRGPTVEEALAVVQAPPPPVAPRARRAEPVTTGPIPGPEPPLPVPSTSDAGDDLPPVPAAGGASTEPSPASGGPPAYTEERQTKLLTVAQAKKLNVLVGKLRDGGWIVTGQLWQAIAGLRDLDTDVLIDALEGRDEEEHRLHWTPLRDALRRPEANQLIDWLEVKKTAVDAGQAEPVPESVANYWDPPKPPPTSPFQPPASVVDELRERGPATPFDQFPEGY